MDQPTFSDLEYQGKKRKTRRELFLERMDGLIPWQSLEDRIRPFYPKSGRGRHPYPLPVMLRTHCVQKQLFYNLSDPGMEDLLYESDPVRRFVGLRLTGPLPDETTILNFRHLLERHELGPALLEEINAHLESQGLRLREGTIVDAGIIEAPSSTKNRSGERDPEMHQTKKGNQWHFGMKAHIGVDADSGIVHRMSTTAANAHDVTEAHNLLHGGETRVWCDAGYQGVHHSSAPVVHFVAALDNSPPRHRAAGFHHQPRLFLRRKEKVPGPGRPDCRLRAVLGRIRNHAGRPDNETPELQDRRWLVRL